MRGSTKVAFLSALAVVVGFVGVLVARAGTGTPAPEARYYFHSGGQPVHVADVVSAGTFDATAPTSSNPSVSVDTSVLAAGTSDGVADAAWQGAAGAVPGVINTVKLDFWSKSPAGLGTESFDVSLWVGGEQHDLGQLTAQPPLTDTASEVVGYFTTDADGKPLAIDATGQAVTVDINGWYVVNQAGYGVLYDSTDYPSGWSVNAPVPTASIAPVTTAPGSASFTSDVQLPGSKGFGEPSIAIAPVGAKDTAGKPQTVYVSSPRGTSSAKEQDQGSPIWRSDDGGATWQGPIVPANLGPATTGMGGGDTDIKTDKDGNVYFADLALVNDVMSVSEDKGASWFGSPVSHPEHPVDDRQWIGYSGKGGGTVYLTFDGTDGVYVERAALDGPLGDKAPLVFTDQSEVTDNVSRGCVCTPGSITVDDSRSGAQPYVYVVLSGSQGLTVWRSDDNASTWAPHVVPGSGTGTSTGNLFEVSAVDAVGNLYVAWAENKNGIQDTFLAVSQDHAQTWKVYDTSESLGATRTTVMPAIAADGTGHVGLAFYATTDTSAGPDSAPAGTKWDLYYLESDDATSDPPTFTVTDVVKDMHNGQICTGGIGCTTGGDRSLLDFFSVAFDADHLANIIYTHGTGTSGADAVHLDFVKERDTASLTPTALTYSGDTTAGSGATATYSATLLDSSATPVPGATVTFQLGSQPAVSATTDASGVATAQQPVTLAAGSYTLTSSYAGDSTYQPATTSTPFTVTAAGGGGGGGSGSGFSLVKVGPKDGGGEPSIAAGPEGNLYVSWPGAHANSATSTDGGQTWPVHSRLPVKSVGDTSVNVDSAGNVYETNLNNVQRDQDQLQGVVFKSFDHGATWPQQGAGFAMSSNSSNQPFLVDRQWADAYIPPGKTSDQARVYFSYHDFGPSQVWVNTSTDGGKTFGPPVDVLTNPPADPTAVAASAQAEASTVCNSIPGGVKVAQSGPHAGRVYVAWLTGDPVSNPATGCNLTQMDTFHSVWIAYSDDGGSTWTPQLVFDGGIGHDASVLFADLTLDDQGEPYVAFGNDPSFNPGDATAEWDMYVMGSQGYDASGAPVWKGPFRASDPTQTKSTFFPAIAVGDPGQVDVAYIGTKDETPTLPYGKPQPGGNAGAAWDVYFAKTVDLFAAQPAWSTTKVTPKPMHVGDVCTLGIFCVDDTTGLPVFGTNRDLLDFIDITLDPHGLAHIAYTDDNTAPGIWAANEHPAPASTSLTVTVAHHQVTAVLTSGGQPLPGKKVEFFVNAVPVGSAVTDASGTASLVPRRPLLRGDLVRAVFAGDAHYAGSEATTTVT